MRVLFKEYLVTSLLIAFRYAGVQCASLSPGELSVSKSILVVDGQDRDAEIRRVDYVAQSQQSNQGEPPIADNLIVKMTQFDDQVSDRQLVSPSLYDLANEQGDENMTMRNIDRLDGGFLLLFDELLRLKNNSVNSLVRLDYFNQTNLNEKCEASNQSARCRQSNKLGTNNDNNSANPNRLWLTNIPKYTNQPTVQIKSDFYIATSRIGTWLDHVRQQMAQFWTQLLVASRLVKPASHRTVNVLLADDDSFTQEPRTTRRPPGMGRNRRQTEGETTEESTRVARPGKRNCAEMDTALSNKCRTTEAMINSTLSSSFPGTLLAIEDNCRSIVFLLDSCWPQQRQKLASLYSWNESMAAMSEFSALNQPVRNYDPSQQNSNLGNNDGNCEIKPTIGQSILDRVDWMFLNLCLDNKFRHDYVEHLKCLSLWTQDRAQSVCSTEFRRMQSHLIATDPSSSTPSGQTPARYRRDSSGGERNQRRPRSPSGIPTEHAKRVVTGSTSTNLTVMSTRNDSSSTAVGSPAAVSSGRDDLERELGSKILCCIFDLFLRCVHKQAIKDCGKAGAQFVVDFMTRIGTDDMKLLCNSEEPVKVRMPQAPQNQMNNGGSNNRRSNPFSIDKSPFIYGNNRHENYCFDPRIQSVIYGHNNGVRNLYPNQSPAPNSRPQNTRNRNRNPANVNHDPTFFGSDVSVPESSAMAIEGTINHAAVSLCVLIFSLLLLPDQPIRP